MLHQVGGSSAVTRDEDGGSGVVPTHLKRFQGSPGVAAPGQEEGFAWEFHASVSSGGLKPG